MTHDSLRTGLRALLEFDEHGRVVVCAGMVLTLYFRQGYRAEVRQAVLACVDEYLGAYGKNLHWWVTEGRKLSSVKALADKRLSTYLLSSKFDQADTDLNWAFLWHGGREKEDASPYRIFGLGASRADCEHLDALSFLTMALPVPLSTEEAGSFERLALGWIDRLCPYHGYGGVAVIASPDDGLAARHEGRVVHHACRYPGVEADFPPLRALFTQQGIKGVNWITVLSDRFIDQLGGPERFVARLLTQFKVHRYDGGLAIVAGQFPEIGGTQEGVATPLYSELYRLVRPIRVTGHPGVCSSSHGFDTNAFEAWLSRLDPAGRGPARGHPACCPQHPRRT